jgi:hypothetical protein
LRVDVVVDDNSTTTLRQKPFQASAFWRRYCEERGVIVISPERGLFDSLLAYLPHLVGESDLADRLLYFDPSDNTNPIVGFNPFHFEASDNPQERQQLITQQAGETYTILTHALGDLGVKMSTLMQNCIYALIQRPNSTLETLEKLIDRGLYAAYASSGDLWRSEHVPYPMDHSRA